MIIVAPPSPFTAGDLSGVSSFSLTKDLPNGLQLNKLTYRGATLLAGDVIIPSLLLKDEPLADDNIRKELRTTYYLYKVCQIKKFMTIRQTLQLW